MSAAVVPRPVTSAQTEGLVGRIPVRNLWLLMLYASEQFRSHGAGQVAAEQSPDDFPNLVAEILARVVEERRRTQLTTGYQPRKATVSRVRGRIDLLNTARRNLTSRGLVACSFEQLTVDTPRNRLVRAALESLADAVDRPELARRCHVLAKTLRFAGVGGPAPSRAQISTERFGRHDAHDRFMVAAACLALELALPSEAAGHRHLPLSDREEIWVRRLFERGIGGFYETVLAPQGWRVHRMRLHWSVEAKTAGIDRILPSMKTDVVLGYPPTGWRLVIDTKFTSILTGGWYREESLRSGHVYQMHAYLRSQTGSEDATAKKTGGLLLHPSVGRDVDETVVMHGHPIRFATVNLTASAAEIRTRLLALTTPC